MQLNRRLENQENAYQRGGAGNLIERPPRLQAYIDERNAWLKAQPPMPHEVKHDLEYIYDCCACPDTLFKYITRPIAYSEHCEKYVQMLYDNGLKPPAQLGGALDLILKKNGQIGGAYVPVTEAEREAIWFAMNAARQRSGMPLMSQEQKKRVIEITNEILEAIDVISAAKGEANSGGGIYDSERFVANFI